MGSENIATIVGWSHHGTWMHEFLLLMALRQEAERVRGLYTEMLVWEKGKPVHEGGPQIPSYACLRSCLNLAFLLNHFKTIKLEM